MNPTPRRSLVAALGTALTLAACTDGTVSPIEDVDGDGYTAADGDCDDDDADINPGATEVCDGLDNNCDAVVDDDAADAQTFYQDADQDTYGNAEEPTQACAQPEGYVSDDTDCDDTDDEVYPGAPDPFYDGVDADCAGDSDFDADGDGYDSADHGGQDCNDDDATISPDADEVCDDLDVDENCNGLSDDGDDTVLASSQTSWHLDRDGDGFGDPATAVLACEEPPPEGEPVVLDFELGDGTRLTDQYAELGVTFTGSAYGIVGGIDEGDPGNWDLNGTNGPNFLGFNGGTYSETATFSEPIGSLVIDAARSGGSADGDAIQVQAYAGGTLVDEDSATFGPINEWATLAVDGTGIDRVVFTGLGGGFHPYGLDNMELDASVFYVANGDDCDDTDPSVLDSGC